MPLEPRETVKRRQQFSTLTGFPNFLLLQGIEKNDFSGHQFRVQKPQQKLIPPQRAFQFLETIAR